MGYDILVILVPVKCITDFYQAHEHGGLNLFRMAGVSVHQSGYRKISLGTRLSLSGR